MKIQWGPLKPRSVGSRDQTRGLYGPWLNFTLILLVYPYYHPCPICDISNFSSVYLTRLHWKHIFPKFVSFSGKFLSIIGSYIYLFHFFSNICCPMTAILPLVSKYSPGGTVLQRPLFQRTLTIWRHFICYCLVSGHDCSQREITVWSSKKFQSSKHRSIILPRLNRTRELTIHGIMGLHCTGSY